MKIKTTSCLIIFTIVAMLNTTAVAVTLEDLLQADKIRIRAWTEPQENIIARQQVNLQIEVATDRWFSGGTKIGAFDVKDAIVLQREKFAVNSSRVENRTTWTVQEWTLAIYPQRAGQFEIPEISVQVSVAGENLESIVGNLLTPPLGFIAILPEHILDGMTGRITWVSTSRFEVKQSFDKSFDDLKPGDAVVRSISMSADNLPAMMLPDIQLAEVDGIAIYSKPPQLQDKINRGTYLAERTQTITYVMEKAGQYLLPAKTFYWWNLNSQAYESIELEAQAFEVFELVGTDHVESEELTPSGQFHQANLTILALKAGISFLFLILIGLVIRVLSMLSRQVPLPQSSTLSEPALRKLFEAACRKNEMGNAMGLFYRWLDNYGGDSFNGSVREKLRSADHAHLSTTFTGIMQGIYTAEQNVPVDLKSFAYQFARELNKSDDSAGLTKFRVELKLN